MGFQYYKWSQFARKCCKIADERIKRRDIIPVDTGYMKNAAIYCAPTPSVIGAASYSIKFDASVAPYIVYNEEGTRPHDIPRAFGYPLPFGIGGQFDGMFHPGSYKNAGFISNRCVREVFLTTLEDLGKMKGVKILKVEMPK